jgi:CHAD domain-containing protein
MGYRLKPGRRISHSVRAIGTEQIDRVLSKFSAKNGKGTAVHEARKAMKRLRALLHLIKPAMPKGAFAANEARVKMIARSLSGARDAQAMLDTVCKLECHEAARTVAPVSAALRAYLEAKRSEAERGLNGSGANPLRKLLKEAKSSFAALSLEPDAFAVVAATLENDYRKARHAFRRAYRLGEDEAFHEWRKYIQRHWRQLLLVAPSWPKAIRPHIALARDLSENLGEDHDLSVLAGLVNAQADHLGNRDQVEAYLSLCQKRQGELRKIAQDWGARLLAEKPGSLSRRVSAYWATAENFKDEEGPSADRSGNVITLNR